jgi:CBS domain-containing protein
MRVTDIMTADVRRCTLETNLAAVANIMWEADCGIVPVTDGHDRVVGVITDRDICIAAATRPRPASEISVQDVISKNVHSCKSTDEVGAALMTMKNQRVRRLPVIHPDGRLAGIVSMNDIVLHAGSASKSTGIPADDVLEVLRSICAHSAGTFAATA